MAPKIELVSPSTHRNRTFHAFHLISYHSVQCIFLYVLEKETQKLFLFVRFFVSLSSLLGSHFLQPV